jgi:hypothetical protein
MSDSTELLVQFFKALADDTRLKMVGLLAREPYSGEQLAAILQLKPATISHHLARLAEAGLVSAKMEGHSKMYALRIDTVHATAERLLANDTLPQQASGLDPTTYDQKVIRDFTRRDGSLRQIPAQEKKRLAVLRHIAKAFDSGREYTEKEVNAILAHYHADTASLRRHLISSKLMRRASGVYWRVETEK